MRNTQLDKNIARVVQVPGPVPPLFAEYAYYVVILYSIMAPAWGISVPLLGAGGMGLLAVYCVWRLKKTATQTYAPLALPLCCAASFIIVQMFIHDQSLMESSNREWVTWLLAITIIHSLLLRHGFLHRFALAAGAIGLLLLPYLDYKGLGAPVERAGLEQGVGLANPNQLAEWFGFCCVYFMVVAIETRRNIIRIASLVIASGCLFVVGLTVSRGTLMAIMIAVIIALRHLLKRGFLPALLLAVLGATIFLSGLFDQAIGLYTERGTEETGRLLVWPLIIDRFLNAPLIGVGIGEIDTYVPEAGHEITPHNAFLYVGLASGIFPLAFFITYWIKAARASYRLSRQTLQDAPFQLPLMIYAFIITFLSQGAFMASWAIVTLCNTMPRRMSRSIALRVASGEAAKSPRGTGKQLTYTAKHRLYTRSLKP
jgi:O-antigen ligase